MIYALASIHIAFCLWVIFLDGASQLEGSWFTLLLFRLGMDAVEIKFWVALSLIVLPFYVFF